MIVIGNQFEPALSLNDFIIQIAEIKLETMKIENMIPVKIEECAQKEAILNAYLEQENQQHQVIYSSSSLSVYILLFTKL